MRVWHFISDPRIGGQYIYVKTLIDTLPGYIEQNIITTGKGDYKARSLLNLKHLWKPLYLIEIIINAIMIVVMGWRAGVNNKNMVFDVHGAVNIAPLIAARILGIAVVWHFHETLTGYRLFSNIGKIFLKKIIIGLLLLLTRQVRFLVSRPMTLLIHR